MTSSAPLPEPVRTALQSIANDLRHLPRDCIIDRAELLVWLRRQAARVEGVRGMKVFAGPKALPRPTPPQRATAREQAQAVFGGVERNGVTQAPRTVMTRRGRPVRVEVRARQLEMGL